MATAKLDIKFSPRVKSLAKYDLTFPGLIFCQLVALGYKPGESAWVAFFALNKYTTNQQLEQRAAEYMRSEKVQQVIAHFKEEVKLAAATASSLDEIISQKLNETGEMGAEETAMEMLRIANTLPDGKEKADLMMKYADLKGFRKAKETSSDNNNIGFVIPTQCHTCPCYSFAMAHGNDEDKKAQNSSRV